MNLGEQIYRLRTEKNLSQGDLADALDVSRQSVSKWENNSSVPDLDKLIKLSALFGVTLDELVTGERPHAEAADTQQPLQVQHSVSLPGHKIAGIILFSMAFLSMLLPTIAFGDLLSGLVLSLPFLLCGVICFIFRKHVGLWCAWVLTFLLDLFLTSATGANWRSLLAYLRGYLPFTWTATTIISLLHLLIMAIMVVVTILRFRKGTSLKKSVPILLSGAVLLVLSIFGESWLFQALIAAANASLHFISYMSLVSLISLLIDWVQLVLTMLLLIFFIRFLRAKKAY